MLIPMDQIIKNSITHSYYILHLLRKKLMKKICYLKSKSVREL